MSNDVPGRDALRQALAEQTPLLTATPTPDPVAVRVHRVLDTAADLLDLPEENCDAGVQDVVTRTLAWCVERISYYHRLPTGYAQGRPVDGGRSATLVLVDDLDLLGLTLDHAYDAAYRTDDDALNRQIAVLTDRFGSGTDPAHLVHTEDPIIDPETAAASGTEVGDDGIPRLPIPEQPDPNHLRENQ